MVVMEQFYGNKTWTLLPDHPLGPHYQVYLYYLLNKTNVLQYTVHVTCVASECRCRLGRTQIGMPHKLYTEWQSDFNL